MENYTKFIGVDIGKFNFVVAIYGEKTTKEYANTSEGISEFLQENNELLNNSLIILEATGGYELTLLYTLCSMELSVHRANTRKVKHFIRSLGSAAKTDALDAKALAHYGEERYKRLELFEPQSQEAVLLFQLVQRRSDLRQMLVAEKNREKAPSIDKIKSSCSKVIQIITKEIDSITQEIKKVIDSNAVLKQKHRVLKTIPGIGDIVGFELLALLPELGSLSRKKIASLAGVAPIARDSGKFKGYRMVGYGRAGVKPMLFIASMAARNSKTHLKEFYEKLISKGKKKMVALTALMRKILVIANARIRDFNIEQEKEKLA